MNEPQPQLQAWLESLRSQGAWRLDPVRFHYLEALSRRLSGQPEPVRRLLQDKLHAALADYAGRLDPAPRAAADGAPPLPAVSPLPADCAPLARLNQYIRDGSTARLGAAAPGETQERDELASVRRFRRAWSSSRTRDQVERAASRKPANAGPLNSHLLVLQSLALMAELSPDYLRRFLVHVESLQWLDRAIAKHPPGQTRASAKPRAGNRRK